MKKNKIFICFIISALLCFNMIYAGEGESLDVVKTAIKMMENDNSLTASADALNNAMEQYNNAKKNPSNYVNLLNSEYQASVSQRALNVKENSMRLDGYQKYINVLKAKYAVELQQEVLNRQKAAYENTQLKVELKLAFEAELETSEGQYTKEKLQLQIKKRDLMIQLTSLNALMGEKPRKEYSIFIDNNMIPAEAIGTLQEYLDSALNNRADILDVTEQIPVKEETRKFAVYSYPNLDDPYYAQLDYEIENLKSELETTKIDIEMELQSKYEELTDSIKALNDAEAEVSETEENMKLMDLKYSLGAITKAAKDAGELEYINAKYALKTAQIDAWYIQEQMNCISGVGL